ncbi:MAG: 4Fe-4S dicluster domain-containing protein [Planctomycetes bacterium]|nr:4Fe-4S dicluster domain-containing protein [Planctomycetota bacterium]
MTPDLPCSGSCAGGGVAPPPPGADADLPAGVSRREFVEASAKMLAAVALVSGCDTNVEEFLQKNFRELTPEELRQVVARLEKKYSEAAGKPVTVTTTPPLPNTLFGYGLDLSRCVGCRRCAYACARENNTSRSPQIQWIRVLELDKEKGVDLTHANAYYNPETVPQEDKFYMPVACHQCAKPPCVKVCPVKATWQEPDGIVVIDYNWCIGCRCCMAACPYGARRFNWGEPDLPAAEVNPHTHYLGNRPRMKGVVEKCTFCIQRVREGRYPACVEICPVGARKFGNLLDPESEIRVIMRQKRVFVLKEEIGTEPKFFYFYAT